MARNRRLSRNFVLSEFPCWKNATELDVAMLQETVDRVLQPTRDRWGRIVPTSWMWWSDGCKLREGSHRWGGTVDFISLDAPLRDVFEWGREELLLPASDPDAYLSRWIYEPYMEDEDGRKLQGEHIHAAPLEDMRLAYGIADVGAYVETSPGVYEEQPSVGMWDGSSGAFGDPIPIPGLTASVPYNWFRWLFVGALAGLFFKQQEA